uniref:Uncharacterized protein n=1 Tax=Oedocladium carolinianum TaxID=55992 RepID=A0A8K1JCB4_9CHLO|nr:hypothetical protein [Oedocladium carolinianum]
MNKVLLIEIVRKLTQKNKEWLVIELDMSACHSRVAGSLLPIGNTLQQALEGNNFWERQINQFLPLYLEKDIEISKKQLKRILKIFLYTSLNGGNPASPDRLIDNLTANVIELLPNNNLKESAIFQVTRYIAEDFQLVKEVKNLNRQCFSTTFLKTYTYTIDRYLPYKNEASYKGISMVLQGFEVVLACSLTQHVVELNGIPLSLDHDGLMALFLVDLDADTPSLSIKQEVKRIEENLTTKLSPWSNYLLKSELPIEAKRHWFQGEVTEY